MDSRHYELTEWLAQELDKPEPMSGMLGLAPGMTLDDAYGIQQGVIAHRVAGGDRVIGYKAALTSKAMQAQVGIDEPLLGTLLASRLFEEEGPVSLGGFVAPTLEPEVGVLMGADLEGPGVTRIEALGAVAGYLPCVEVGDVRAPDAASRAQQVVACNTFNGGHVFGQPLTAPTGIDLRLEGVVLRVNGELRGSATAVEVLGDPLNAVVFLANKVAELGGRIEAGMVLMTGSVIASVPVAAGDAVDVEFTRLGRVRVRFAP